MRLTALDEVAEAIGLRKNQGVAEARAMCPKLDVVEEDLAADRRLLDGIADWCDRYTPLVALDGRDGPWGGNALASNGHLHEAALSFLGSMDGGDDDPDWPRTGPGSVSDLRSRRRSTDETSDGAPGSE